MDGRHSPSSFIYESQMDTSLPRSQSPVLAPLEMSAEPSDLCAGRLGLPNDPAYIRSSSSTPRPEPSALPHADPTMQQCPPFHRQSSHDGLSGTFGPHDGHFYSTLVHGHYPGPETPTAFADDGRDNAATQDDAAPLLGHQTQRESVASDVTMAPAPATPMHQRTSRSPTPRPFTHADMVDRVEDICLIATQKYLGERNMNWKLRGSGHTVDLEPLALGREQQSCFSVREELAARRPSYQPRRGRAPSAINMRPTESLLQNVSHICTGIWSQAQRDRAHVPRAERMAVENMQHLLKCAETITGYDAQQPGCGDSQRELCSQVIKAGKNICSWLDEAEGWVMLQELEDGENP